MQSKVQDTLQQVLLQVVEYQAQDFEGKTRLNKPLIIEKAQNYDPALLKLLLSDATLKDTFFISLDNGTTIFKQTSFISFLDSQEFLPSSFTTYSQRIGLATDRKHFLQNNRQVVLNFPYKDCILAGDQKEDSEKQDEVFYNAILAPDEVNRLLDYKVFTNATRYSKDGTTKITHGTNSTDGKEEADALKESDNLIIKGNNLLVLHSLKARYSKKVKLIYIDPPYNTGSDSFNYNDSFNHSTWLTFMKNRLEVARSLLREDGVIAVQCDDNEQAYLKVLCDEVFSRDNFIATIVWANREGGGKSDSKFFRQKHEYILCFAKEKDNLTINSLPVEDIERYKLSDKYESTRGKYQLIKLDSGSLGWVKSLDYPIELEGHTFYAGGNKDKWLERQNGGANIKDWGWRWSKEKLEWGIKNDFVVIKQVQGVWNIYTKQYLNCDKDGNIIPRTLKPLALIDEYSNTQSNRHFKELGISFNYSKPEALLKRIIEITTAPGDLVLDYHLGSGTTAAVAHKMGRHYIGIEQMDYIESITIKRMQKVLEGEEGGISRSVEWKGGGSFVYLTLTLAPAGVFLEKVKKASSDELDTLYSEVLNAPYLRYEVEKEAISKEEFSKLKERDKRRLLYSMVDKSVLYLNYSEIMDKNMKVSEADKAINKWFYEEN